MLKTFFAINSKGLEFSQKGFNYSCLMRTEPKFEWISHLFSNAHKLIRISILPFKSFSPLYSKDY
ncbi:hypothetical protein HMPREF1410_01496 [Helicobacter pylori GAM249T]|nr:hypothetical protein HMPREF1410_01496 [Helicobacter pylori GAM249T]